VEVTAPDEGVMRGWEPVEDAEVVAVAVAATAAVSMLLASLSLLLLLSLSLYELQAHAGAVDSFTDVVFFVVVVDCGGGSDGCNLRVQVKVGLALVAASEVGDCVGGFNVSSLLTSKSTSNQRVNPCRESKLQLPFVLSLL
jgi:hypothetical protein